MLKFIAVVHTPQGSGSAGSAEGMRVRGRRILGTFESATIRDAWDFAERKWPCENSQQWISIIGWDNSSMNDRAAAIKADKDTGKVKQ